MKNTYTGLLGAHMSISGGIDYAFWRGHSIGCTTIQLFTHSNRSWYSKDLTSATIDAVKKAQEKTGITVAIAHTSYLINLGSLSPDTVKKSISTLKKELIYCDQLSIPYLILHPGSGTKDPKKCIQQIGESLNILFDSTVSSAIILLETMAGQGSSVGYTFEQLAAIRGLVEDKKRIGICLDTCHIWAAGYDFSTKESYNAMWHQFEKTIGLSHLKAIHLNDSQKPRGSRVDRHADIGKGTISLEPFRLLMQDARFVHIPKVIETPNDTLEGYAHNLHILKDLL